MAQIKTQTIKNKWTEFSDIELPVSDKTYYIQNRGPGSLIACEGSSEPEENEGMIVHPGKVLKYVLGSQDLYLRALGKSITVNVSDEG